MLTRFSFERSPTAAPSGTPARALAMGLVVVLTASLVGCGTGNSAPSSAGNRAASPAVGQVARPNAVSQPAAPVRRIHAAANGYVTAHHPEWRQKIREPMNVIDKQSRWEVHFGIEKGKQLVLEMDKQTLAVRRAAIQ